MIIDDIRNSQLGNQQAMLNLVERFTPALRKYARKLATEDAFNDLVLELLELILHLDCSSIRQQGDGAMVNYLSRAIYCSYIKLLDRLIKNKIPCVSDNDVTDAMLYQHQHIEMLNVFPFEIPKDLLSPCEEKAFFGIHIMGYSAAEIARHQGTSRQNINQAKRRAEQKLRNYLKESNQL